ncbi:MAG: hypothetical protein E7314_05790 [Clostridiales bacterium]|nr:hypothetical protein [Clostridiales bacterium]
MQIISILFIWLTNSFKWFAYLVGIALIYYYFSKEKHNIDNTFNNLFVIQALLLTQPIAIANVLNHYNVQGQLVAFIVTLAFIPGIISLCIHPKD